MSLELKLLIFACYGLTAYAIFIRSIGVVI